MKAQFSLSFSSWNVGRVHGTRPDTSELSMGFFSFLFAFLLGGIVSLLGGAFAIYYFLIIYERKTDDKRKKLAAEASPEDSVF